MTEPDVLVGFRLRLFTLADGLANVSAACRTMGVDRSSSYRWKAKVDRWGMEAFNIRECRRPRMPNQIGPHLEQRIIAFSLGHPGYGTRRISAELAREKGGGIRISEHGVWRVLVRVGLNTGSKRLALIARATATPTSARPTCRHRSATSTPPSPARRSSLTASSSACSRAPRAPSGSTRDRRRLRVYVGRAAHHERNPRARYTRELVHRVAAELAAAGWKLREVTTDNGSEFRAGEFRSALDALDARQRFIRAGRPNTNGGVERVQLTILEECWRPTFARSLVPKSTALAQDLAEYLNQYNYDRADTGRLTKGRLPGDIVHGARKMTTVR